MSAQKIDRRDPVRASTALDDEAVAATDVKPVTEYTWRNEAILPFGDREHMTLLVLVDLLGIGAGVWLALGSSTGLGWSAEPLSRHLGHLVLLALLWLPLAATFDAYEVVRRGQLGASLAAAAKAATVTFLVFFLLATILPLGTSPQVVTLGGGVGLALLLAGRGVFVVIQPAFRRRAVIVGTGPRGRALLEAFRREAGGLYEVVGWVEPAETRAAVIEVLPVLGRVDDLPALIREHRVQTVIWAGEASPDEVAERVLAACLEAGAAVVPMPALYETLTGRVLLLFLGSQGLVALLVEPPGMGLFFRVAKRVMDIVLASLGLVFLGVALPFIALAIYLDSPGPVFYAQERVGKGGRIFRAYKFRSMVSDAEKGKALWAQENDPRVTRVGRILRKTHLDEFPQFLNILKGEMSAVGPRPERPEFAAELEKEIPLYRVRHAVKPGMAGWGLVKHGYAASKEDTLVKLQYDLYYIKHQSIWLDIVILLKTFIDTFTLGGR